MKNYIYLICYTIVLSTTSINHLKAQETYGNTVNIGIGVGGYGGYYHYTNATLPVLHFDYELNVAKNFTLAPFINFASYTNDYYWGNNNTPYRYYTYRETVIPIGLKGSFYFDELLKATSKWDFYLAGSLGFAVINSRWEQGYNGNRDYYKSGNLVFMDIHMGAEYHFNSSLGAFLDLSTGVSTIGLAIHTKQVK
ncbi:MAG: hypothetical protein EAY81_07805 [Bacteroidetes bacterium]|nr:MAG: hypothetical protein EAY81_07805 [Bacteroidota bacterium]